MQHSASHVAADFWTKPIGLSHKLASRLGYITIAIYYYSAGKLILILPSRRG